MLILSSAPPIEVYDDAGSALENILSVVAGRSLESGATVPVFFTFDYVKSIYPDLGIRSSTWPQVAALVPTKTLHGQYVRSNVPGKYRYDRTEDVSVNLNIAEAIHRIRNGELLQVVLSSRVQLASYDFGRALKAFMEMDSSLYVFLYRFGNFTIIGSSPENLVTAEAGKLRIYPIAGSRPRGRNEEEDIRLAGELMNDSKELLEHRMLVDLARNDLGKVSVPGSVKVTSSMEVQKFRTVQHLVSCVESTLEEGTTLDGLMKGVFPAGTVSGAPKKKAIELIDRYEVHPRGPYSGAIGLASQTGIDAALLIRSVFSDNTGIYAQAGAGIVKDSNPSSEEREISAKLGTVTVVTQ